jgi:hypothetical protein
MPGGVLKVDSMQESLHEIGVAEFEIGTITPTPLSKSCPT